MEKEKSIAEILEETTQQMCDNYCKYPEKYTPEEWEGLFEQICYNCPLSRLT